MRKLHYKILTTIALAAVAASTLEAQTPRTKIPARTRAQVADRAVTELFPLAVGNRWTFAGEGRIPQEARTVLVTGRKRAGDHVYFELDGWSYAPALVRMTANGRLMAYNEETGREELWYDFSLPGGASWTPEFRNDCTGTANVLSRATSVAVPAGEFADAFLIGYRGTECLDAGFSEEAFVPGIGPIKQGMISIAGETKWVLVEASIGPDQVPMGGLSLTLSTDQPLYYVNMMPPVDPDTVVPRMQAAITVRNATENIIPLTFRDGQTYDFLIRDAQGRVLYRWSEGKFFTQAVRREEFGPGLRSYTAEIPLGLNGEPFAEGEYTLEAWLTAQPSLETAAVEERYPYSASVAFSIRRVF